MLLLALSPLVIFAVWALVVFLGVKVLAIIAEKIYTTSTGKHFSEAWSNSLIFAICAAVSVIAPMKACEHMNVRRYEAALPPALDVTDLIYYSEEGPNENCGAAIFVHHTQGFSARRALELLAELPPGAARRTHALRLKLKATRMARQPLAMNQPESVAVVGAGIAGSSVALALCQRGVQVHLYDQGDGPATGASGNWVGAFHPHITRGDSPLSRLSRLGFEHTVQALNTLTEQGFLQKDEDWATPGHLQTVPVDEAERTRETLANHRPHAQTLFGHLPPHHVRRPDRTQIATIHAWNIEHLICDKTQLFKEFCFVDRPILVVYSNSQYVTQRTKLVLVIQVVRNERMRNRHHLLK